MADARRSWRPRLGAQFAPQALSAGATLMAIALTYETNQDIRRRRHVSWQASHDPDDR